jgi:3-oxoacyl-(acyl-carrier-protein) synthase
MRGVREVFGAKVPAITNQESVWHSSGAAGAQEAIR